jgi:DNA polymerase-3 subunit epsilon
VYLDDTLVEEFCNENRYSIRSWMEIVMRGYAVIDCETTGLNKTGSDRIAEIAIATYDMGFNLTGQYETLINPEQDLGMTSLHGINGLMASNAPKFEQVMDSIAHLLHDRIIIGHNVEFDLKFIAHEFSKEKIDLQWKGSYLDTLKMAKDANLVSENNQLSTLCSHFGIPLLHAHSAMADVIATGKLFQALLNFSHNGVPSLAAPLQVSSQMSSDVSKWIPREVINQKISIPYNWDGFLQQLPKTGKELSPQDKYTYLNSLHLCLINNAFTYKEGEVMEGLIRFFSLSHQQVIELNEEYIFALLSHDLTRNGNSVSDFSSVRTALEFTGVEESRVVGMRGEVLNNQGMVSTGLQTFQSLFSLNEGDGLVITGEEFSKSKQHLKATLQSAGFRVLPSTTKSGTKALIANDPYSLSNKATTARRFGIPILTEGTIERLISNS